MRALSEAALVQFEPPKILSHVPFDNSGPGVLGGTLKPDPNDPFDPGLPCSHNDWNCRCQLPVTLDKLPKDFFSNLSQIKSTNMNFEPSLQSKIDLAEKSNELEKHIFLVESNQIQIFNLNSTFSKFLPFNVGKGAYLKNLKAELKKTKDQYAKA